MKDGGRNKPDLQVVGVQGSEDIAAATQWATRDEWLAHGRRLGERVERDRWALGDWACHGERVYGELAAAAADIGIGYGYLRNLASVARKIELSRRRDNLSLDHHAAVAALPPDVGNDLLDRAEAEGWSQMEMREEARAVSELGQLKAWYDEVLAENARLRQKRDPDNIMQIARETVEQALVRMKAESRVVREATSRAAAMFQCLGAAEIAGNIHGNKRKTLARDSARAFGVLSSQVRTARADAAPVIESIANSGKVPVQAAIGALMDDIDETLREITRRLDAAELDPAQAKAVNAAFDTRMDAIGKVVENDVHPALDRKLAGEC